MNAIVERAKNRHQEQTERTIRSMHLYFINEDDDGRIARETYLKYLNFLHGVSKDEETRGVIGRKIIEVQTRKPE